MEFQHRVNQQRIQHIIDSYTLKGDEVAAFEKHLAELLAQYPHGLVELALVETLVKGWLTIPMERGVAFLTKAHNWLKQWQQAQSEQQSYSLSLTPSQFSQITGLDAQFAFDAIDQATNLPTQAAAESA